MQFSFCVEWSFCAVELKVESLDNLFKLLPVEPNNMSNYSHVYRFCWFWYWSFHFTTPFDGLMSIVDWIIQFILLCAWWYCSFRWTQHFISIILNQIYIIYLHNKSGIANGYSCIFYTLFICVFNRPSCSLFPIHRSHETIYW